MPRRHRHRRRNMKGGVFEDLTNTLSGWGSSISQGASSMWQKTKDATSSATSSLTGATATTTPPTTSYTAPMTTTSYGGKHRRSRRRHMKGGFEDNIPTTGLAAHAAPFSGQTAQPLTIIGGRTRKRCRKGGCVGALVNQAVVPVALLGMQQTYRRRKGGRTRRHHKR